MKNFWLIRSEPKLYRIVSTWGGGYMFLPVTAIWPESRILGETYWSVNHNNPHAGVFWLGQNFYTTQEATCEDLNIQCPGVPGGSKFEFYVCEDRAIRVRRIRKGI